MGDGTHRATVAREHFQHRPVHHAPHDNELVIPCTEEDGVVTAESKVIHLGASQSASHTSLGQATQNNVHDHSPSANIQRLCASSDQLFCHSSHMT